MAKQRRPRLRATAKKRRIVRKTSARSAVVRPGPPAKVQPPPQKLATYPEAVALYERGIEALQRRNFRLAGETLRAVIRAYPEERELHERARLYVRICERETGPPPPPPQTPEECVYAATVSLNAGAHRQALDELLRVGEDQPGNDHVQYMLAVAYALQHEPELAVARLRRAIELNPENRLLARQEADFHAIRDNEEFRQALESPPHMLRRRARRRIAL